MHITIYESRSSWIEGNEPGWYWQIERGNGYPVYDNQRFDTRANAARAARTFVSTVVARIDGVVFFSKLKYHAPSKTYRIFWE